ncbi:DUF6246 family protein [Pseudacidovorax intermedius]|uniref:DUF6246 family protein n=1 Tax=Pseudacidovorax intermedius TaxID=433924 RepID=UPI0007345297|nr:DUF6246 family protein [Pseudacidovorax intermedius]
MLVEHGYVRAEAPDGTVYTFCPSFARVAALDSPAGIVALFVALHGPGAADVARYVLAVLCEQDDPTPLIGCLEAEEGAVLRQVDGAMPAAEQVILARHLMQHGICGTAAPGQGGGEYSQTFDAAEFVSAARVHLGLPATDAEALSMTELQHLMRLKFPDPKAGEVPDEGEYEATMALVRGKNG